jgi:c-di-GMP-binding flagellar brake protein YcgR
MGDRRHLERFDLSVPARLVVHNSRRNKEVYETNTCNISAGGAFFKTEHFLSEGTKVELDFIIPVEKLGVAKGVSSFVKISGRVLRSDSKGIAICFDKNYEIMPFRNL